jgi:tRNA(Arg) A34 adenosine deaminase TadA
VIFRNESKRKAGSVIVTFSVNEYLHGSEKSNETIHAEVNALKNVPKKYWNQCILVVWRVRNDGSLACSKPCKKCTPFLNKHEIPVIYYSTGIGMEFLKL